VNNKTVDIVITVRTSKVGSDVQRVMRENKEDWDSMSDMEKSDAVEEFVSNHGMFEVSWRER
jgi:hypothetical protein